MKFAHRKSNRGFSLVELLVVVVLSALIISGFYMFLSRQRKVSTIQRLKANTESIAQIAFFIIGRDIRRAGSNPAGAMGYDVGAAIPIALAASNQIQILADLDGNGSVEPNTDENITYQYIDDPANPDGIPDRILRQSGNQLVIENVRAFDLSYQLVGTSTWASSTASPELIRLVRVHMVAGTGKVNPDTNQEDTKEIRMDFLLRNFR